MSPRVRLLVAATLAGLLVAPPADARRRRAPVPATAAATRPLPVQAWLGPLRDEDEARALTGAQVSGRDGPACWRAVPAALVVEDPLARAAAGAPSVALHALVERAASGVVLARGEVCLATAGWVTLAVASPARVRLAVDGHRVGAHRAWAAPRGPAPQHSWRVQLGVGCHAVVAALASPRGRLTLAWGARVEGGATWARAAPPPARKRASSPKTAPDWRRCDPRWQVRRAARAPAAQPAPDAALDALLATLRAPPANATAKTKPPAGRRAALAALARRVELGQARGPRRAAVWAALRGGVTESPRAAEVVARSLAESGDRIAALRAATARWPKDTALGLALVATLDDAGKVQEARRTWQRSLVGAERTSPEACAARALLWQRLDVPQAAWAGALDCARRFPRAAVAHGMVARLAVAHDDLGRALQARRALLALAPNDPEVWLAALVATTALAEGAPVPGGPPATLVNALRSAPPVASAWDLARARNALGLAWLRRGEGARAETLLRGVPGWARRAFTLELLARSLLQQPQGSEAVRAARRVEATALLRSALRSAPTRADLRTRLSLLAPGRDFYTPYARDLIGLARAAVAKPVSAVPFRQLLRQTVVRQLGQGRLARYEVAVFRVGQGGPRSHDVEIEYVPSQAHPEVLQAALVRKGGRVIRSVPQRQESLSEGAEGLYYDLERVTLPFKDLEDGDVVVVAYALRDFAADPFGAVFSELFQLGDAWPVDDTEIVLELDPKLTPLSAWRRPPRGTSNAGGPRSGGRRRSAEVRRGVLTERGLISSADGKQRWRRWRFAPGGLPATPVEGAMPGASEVVDTLHVTSFASWSRVARWYAAQVRTALPKRASDPALTALAKRLTEGQTTAADKTRALYRWVADHIRYVGLEFGIHSLRPHPVRQVLARRFGDCKDKATLLVALLAEVGVPAQVVLVRTADEGLLQDGLASLSGFGHAIAYAPSLGWWMDATLQHHQPQELPAGDVGGQGLPIPLDGQGSALVDLPDAGPAANTRDEETLVTLEPGGAATLHLTVRARGLVAARMRKRLHAEVSRVERAQADLAARFPGVQVTSVQVSGVHPQGDEVVVRVEARAPRVGNGGRWQPLAPPTPWKQRAGQAASRSHPQVTPYGWRDSRRVTVQPAAKQVLTSRVGQWQETAGTQPWQVAVVSRPGGGWAFSRTVTRTRRRLPATEFAAWRKRLAALDLALSAELAVGGGR